METIMEENNLGHFVIEKKSLKKISDKAMFLRHSRNYFVI